MSSEAETAMMLPTAKAFMDATSCMA